MISSECFFYFEFPLAMIFIDLSFIFAVQRQVSAFWLQEIGFSIDNSFFSFQLQMMNSLAS